MQQLREHFPTCEITLVMNDPKSYVGGEKPALSFLAWAYQAKTKPLIRFAWLILTSLIPALTQRVLHRPLYLPISKEIQPAICALIEADIVIGVPGGNLYSYGKGRALLYMAYTMALALISGKPLYLFPQSYGPFQHRYERTIMRWLFSKSRGVMVREPASLEYLTKIGVPKSKCQLLPDMAFAYQQGTEMEIDALLLSLGINLQTDRPLLGLSIIDWGSLDKEFKKQSLYETVIAQTIKYFVAKYRGKAILFPQCWGPTEPEDDRIPSKRVANLIPDYKEDVIAINTPMSAKELKSAYGKMDIFIGTRMHANIFALTENVPVIAIGYLHKTLGTARLVGITPWVIDINHIDQAQMINKLDNLWNEREKIRSNLSVKIPQLAEQVKQAATYIYNDYTQGSESYSK